MFDIINSVGNIVFLDVSFQDRRTNTLKIGINRSPLQFLQVMRGTFTL